MDTSPHTTDHLIEFIVTTGINFPYYDYELNKYIAKIPRNKFVGHDIISDNTVYEEDIHYTFRDACLHIIKWNEERNDNIL